MRRSLYSTDLIPLRIALAKHSLFHPIFDLLTGVTQATVPGCIVVIHLISAHNNKKKALLHFKDVNPYLGIEVFDVLSNQKGISLFLFYMKEEIQN